MQKTGWSTERRHCSHTHFCCCGSPLRWLASKFGEAFVWAEFSFKLWFQHEGCSSLLIHLTLVLKVHQLLAQQTRWSQPEKIFKCSLHLLASLWSLIKCENTDCELGTGFLWIFQRHIHKIKWNKMKCVAEALQNVWPQLPQAVTNYWKGTITYEKGLKSPQGGSFHR